eukprot:564490_1
MATSYVKIDTKSWDALPSSTISPQTGKVSTSHRRTATDCSAAADTTPSSVIAQAADQQCTANRKCITILIISLLFLIIGLICIGLYVSSCTTTPTPYPLTGVYFMNKAYNMLSGKDIYLQPGADIISYQWKGTITSVSDVSSGQTAYEVPIEFRSVPVVAPQCEINQQVNSVYYAMSTSVLHENAESSSRGFSMPVTLGVGVNTDSQSLEATIHFTNSLMFGRSSGSTHATEYASKSYTWSFSMESSVKYYQAAIDWNDETIDFQYKASFLQSLDDLDQNPNNKTVLSFINTWGSHVLSQMQTGAVCKETAFASSKSSMNEVSDFQNHVASDSSGFLFYTSESESSSETEKSGTYDNGVEYQFDNIYCKGEVDSSACGGITGTNNNPVVISYELLSIFDIEEVVSLLQNDTMLIVTGFFQNLYDSMYECSHQYCNSNGTCTLDEYVWNSEFIENTWDGIDFSMLWNIKDTSNYYCFCNDGWFGNDCSQSSDCSCFGEADCCCYTNNKCNDGMCCIHCVTNKLIISIQAGLLCDPSDSKCIASANLGVQCGKAGWFVQCNAGVITSTCGSGANPDCGQRSGKCPDGSYTGIQCDYIDLGEYVGDGQWFCTGDSRDTYGVSQSCLDNSNVGNLMIGICGSGGGIDCKKECVGNAGILCGTIDGVDVDASECEWVVQHEQGYFESCPGGYVATGWCASGSLQDCDDRHNANKLRCCKLSYI